MSTNILGKNMKICRKSLGWTLTKLSYESKIPFSTLNKLEIGAIKNPTLETLLKLTNALNTSLDQLVGRNI